MSDQKNLILAIALSVAIIIGFNFFISPQRTAGPPKEAQTTQAPGAPATPAAPSAPSAPAAPSAPGAAAPPAQPVDPVLARTESLAKSPRVKIATPSLQGSIALKGGRLDDLLLAKYHETIDPKSPLIVLLSPSGAPNAYFADFGIVAGNGGKLAVPGPDALWTASNDMLTPEQPVTLTWDNGQGQVFERVIAVDKDYMF